MKLTIDVPDDLMKMLKDDAFDFHGETVEQRVLGILRGRADVMEMFRRGAAKNERPRPLLSARESAMLEANLDWAKGKRKFDS